ncbi:large subunit ribosomal protein L13e [Nematocida sp. AWRm77]|nr:large subunit ribosomal protein L13e [Nematocida sp. AWRm77]
MKHNNALTTGHFKKTALMYKLWFKQPIQKRIRKERRQEKARRIAPCNVETLKPVVMCLSRRYNMKERLGRGFSLGEIKCAGITPDFARKHGIAVDTRRYNNSEEGVERNVQRIKEYLANIQIFESRPEAKSAGVTQHKGVIMPVEKKKPVIESMSISEVKAELGACEQMNRLRDECIKKRTLKERRGTLRTFMSGGVSAK